MGSKKKKGSANKSQTPSTPHHIPLLQLNDVPQHVLQSLGQIFQEYNGLFFSGCCFHVSLQAHEANKHDKQAFQYKTHGDACRSPIPCG